MSIESEIFRKAIVNFDKLKQFGFSFDKNEYTYSQFFMSDSFKALIKIDKLGNVSGEVFDVENNEIYYPLKVENISGAYVSKVRNEYENILYQIKKECFEENNFIFPQANRIANLIKQKYNDSPVFMWDKFPEYGVFKNGVNKKWYGIIMNINRSKLDKTKNDDVEIINLKLTNEKITELLNQKGFYPAWHMNKKTWISVVLDETLSDETIMGYIDESYKSSIKKN